MVAKGKPLFSFEFFPPKTPGGERSLFRSLESLRQLEPAFVSVTCAGGNIGKTVAQARQIRDDLDLEAVVHLTCLGVPRDRLVETIRDIREAGLINILALRGDPRADAPQDAPCFASDFVALIREVYPEACVLGACYPEGHVEADNLTADLLNLKKKTDAGVDVLVSQLFFDNRHYFEFVGRARTMGITAPVLAGVMPIQNLDQVRRFTQMCGAKVPEHLHHLLEQYRVSDGATFYIGVAHALSQSAELLASGAPGVHFYTLNKSPATRLVVEALRRELG